MCYGAMILIIAVLIIIALCSGEAKPDWDEKAPPKLKKLPEEETGIKRPRICAVTVDFRYKGKGMWHFSDMFIARWVAAYRGTIIGESPWFMDRYSTKVELRKLIPYIGNFCVPTFEIQQKAIDETQDLSAVNYWNLIEALEKAGWVCRYSNDGSTSSMVKTSMPTKEPVRPTAMRKKSDWKD